MTERHSRDVRRWAGVSLLGLCHGCGDFNAGILLAMIGSESGADLVMMYLLYNVLAFVGQPFAGLICDRLGRPHRWFYAGCLLSVLSLLVVGHQPELAIICSGVASAFYHSAGGKESWLQAFSPRPEWWGLP
jgi:MFS family permease